jgi:hypothetical protein
MMVRVASLLIQCHEQTMAHDLHAHMVQRLEAYDHRIEHLALRENEYMVHESRGFHT